MPLAFRQWHLYRFDFMAQREGFEPSCGFPQTDFESCAEKALAEQGGSEMVSLSPIFRRCQAVFEEPKPEKWR